MRKISVTIVDDHTLFRKAMINLLKGFQRVGEVSEAEDGKDFIDQFQNQWPDVILLDLEMPRMNGVELAEYIIPKVPNLKVIVLTQHDSEKYILNMMELGVHSFLLKNANPDELERAISAVMDKDFYHNDFLDRVLRKSIQNKSQAERPSFELPLTQRELDIVKHICHEKTYKEIAISLQISEFTVRNHHQNILRKLGLKKTIGLVRYAYEHGLMD